VSTRAMSDETPLASKLTGGCSEAPMSPIRMSGSRSKANSSTLMPLRKAVQHRREWPSDRSRDESRTCVIVDSVTHPVRTPCHAGDNSPIDRNRDAVETLGLPSAVRACLFDLDGVLTQTAKVHAAA